jgi:hypothetical protein
MRMSAIGKFGAFLILVALFHALASPPPRRLRPSISAYRHAMIPGEN